jgi:hypothetical protein
VRVKLLCCSSLTGVEKLLLPRIALPVWAGQGGPQRS